MKSFGMKKDSFRYDILAKLCIRCFEIIIRNLSHSCYDKVCHSNAINIRLKINITLINEREVQIYFDFHQYYFLFGK